MYTHNPINYQTYTESNTLQKKKKKKKNVYKFIHLIQQMYTKFIHLIQ